MESITSSAFFLMFWALWAARRTPVTVTEVTALTGAAVSCSATTWAFCAQTEALLRMPAPARMATVSLICMRGDAA